MKNSIIIGVVLLAIVGFAVFSQTNNDKASEAQPITNMQNTNQNQEMEQQMDQTNQKNIVETAIEAGDFQTLVTAVQEAGLVETLSGPGPFTVFAPTDAAFEKIPTETLNGLLEDPEALTEVLTYHVVPGKVMAEDVLNLTTATTVQGSDVTIDASEGVMINNANVVQTDIETSNGVIHVIDTVLLPNN
jgi:uncharacterized surface protein with fasciclin (FAS1) repeats